MSRGKKLRERLELESWKRLEDWLRSKSLESLGKLELSL